MSKKSLPHLHYNDVQHYYEQAIAELPSILNIQNGKNGQIDHPDSE